MRLSWLLSYSQLPSMKILLNLSWLYIFLVQIEQLPTQFFPLNLLHRLMCEAISPPTDSFLASPVLSQNNVLSQVTNHWKWPPLHSHKVDLQLGPSEYTSGKTTFKNETLKIFTSLSFCWQTHQVISTFWAITMKKSKLCHHFDLQIKCTFEIKRQCTGKCITKKNYILGKLIVVPK